MNLIRFVKYKKNKINKYKISKNYNSSINNQFNNKCALIKSKKNIN